MSHLEAAASWSGCRTWHRCQRMEHPVAVLQWVQKIDPSSPLSHTCFSEHQSHLRNYKNHSINNMQTFKSRPNGLVSILFCFRRIHCKMRSIPSEIISGETGEDVIAYLKAGFNDSKRQHAHTSDGPGTCPKQYGLCNVWCMVLKEVLLQGVEGAEVDAHTRDAANKWLPEGTFIASVLACNKYYFLKIILLLVFMIQQAKSSDFI